VRYRAANHWDQMRPAALLTVEDLVAVTPQAYRRLWQYCCEVDLVTKVEAPDRSIDEMLPWLLADARVVRQTGRFDFVWLRMLDVGAALSTRRYPARGRIVIEVVDPLGLAGGRYTLDGGPDGATCRAAPAATPDLTFGVDGLGSVYMGGWSVQTLASAGWVDEHRAGAVATADAMLHSSLTPWCSTWF
jgi:predicted acetyltransferase